MDLTPRQREWTPDTTARFWAYRALRADHSRYFSNQVGAGLVNFARLAGVLRGQVLDYGCGPGYLIAQLLRHPVRVFGCDVSSEAVAVVNQRFQAATNWCGAAVSGNGERTSESLGGRDFDLVYCVETLEHLTDQSLEHVLRDILQLTRPGGYIIVTTPCAEDLQKGYVYCPFCNSEFHHVQHLRSFTPQSMTETLTQAGLRVVFTRSLNFANFQEFPSLGPLRTLSAQRAIKLLRYRRRWILDRFLPRTIGRSRVLESCMSPGPHLCALAQRLE